MQNEMDVLRDVTNKLSQAGIQYMLTGSFALNYYAEPRMTRDIDIVVALVPGESDRVIRLFETEYYIPRNAVTQGIANQTLFNIIHTLWIVKVDFIIRQSSEYRRLEFDRRQQVRIDDTMIWIVSKEDLIVSKLIWAQDSHSDFQLRDVKNLLKSGYDAEYLNEWTERLSLSDVLKEASDD